jgi:hypothetical protein
MRVPLIDDWQTKIKSMKLGRAYSLSSTFKEQLKEGYSKDTRQRTLEDIRKNQSSNLPY